MKKKEVFYLSIVAIIALAFGVSIWTSASSIAVNFSPIVIPHNGEKWTVIVDSPSEGALISNPVTIEGKANDNIFNEHSLVVYIKSSNGELLGQGPVITQNKKDEDDRVLFAATIPFQTHGSVSGFVELKLVGTDGKESVASEIPVIFEDEKMNDCKISGCSRQLCSSEEGISTCEWKPEYACYSKAVCEKQSNGTCGWTETEDFKQCIEDARKNNSGV